MIGLLIFEVGLRIAGISYPNFYSHDECLGASLQPGAEGWWRKEGEAYIRINSDGLRDREHTKEKPANTVRIAVLGDSYAEAFQVPMENAFWAVTERHLQGCQNLDGKRVEVINFGVAGYGTAQELITLRQRVWNYSPDIVVLAITTGNDIRDNSQSLEKAAHGPYFSYRDGKLDLDTSFRNSSGFRLRLSIVGKMYRLISDHSRVIQVINNVRDVIKIHKAARRFSGEGSNEELGLDNMIYLVPVDPAWNDAWRITEGLIVLMRDEVKGKGAKFLVVTLSNGIQVNPDPLVRQELIKRMGVDDLFYPESRIKALGERERIPVLNLALTLRGYAEQHKIFLHGFKKGIGNGHWNTVGHRIAGEQIAQRLCEEIAK